MAICQGCGNDKFGYALVEGYCSECRMDDEGRKRMADEAVQPSGRPREKSRSASRIILTTEAAPNLPIDRRLDIISAEVVIGMHLFKDIAGVFRDVFGGRSKLMQDGLREARKTALDELRREAAALGADAVVGVDLDYSEISGGGKSMLFLVASGTAVTLRTEG